MLTLPTGRASLVMTPRVVTAADVILEVCDLYSITRETLVAEDRRRSSCEPRFVAAWVMREVSLLSMEGIGEMLDRDHTTILNALRTARKRLTTDELFAARCDYVRRRVIARRNSPTRL